MKRQQFGTSKNLSKVSNGDKKDKSKKDLTIEMVNDKNEELREEISFSLKKLEQHKNDDPDSDLILLRKIVLHIDSATGFSRIPAILKVLVEFYKEFKTLYETKTDQNVKKLIADILSYIATAHPPDSNGEVLKYYLLGSRVLVFKWGIGYVRDLTKDIVDKWKNKTKLDKADDRKTLLRLIKNCSIFLIRQNSEIEACDLLIETDQMNLLTNLINNLEECQKICDYIIVASTYMPEPDNKNILYTAMTLCLNNNRLIEAFYVALQLRDMDIIERIFFLCTDKLMQKQMAFIVARHNISMPKKPPFDSELLDPLSNAHLSYNFMTVVRHLDVVKPKAPNEIVSKDNKHRKRQRRFPNVNIQMSILGTSFMNCFINAAFSSDKMLLTEKGLNWICRHKDWNRISAVASLGILCLWDVDGGLNKIDRFLYSKDECIKAGGLMAFGIVNSTVKSEFEPAFNLLKDYVSSDSQVIQLGSIAGLGIAYMGTSHPAVLDTITSVMKSSLDEEDEDKEKTFPFGISSLTCGLIAHSSGDLDIIRLLVQILIKEKMKLCELSTRNIIHGIGLVAMNQKDNLANIMKVLEHIEIENVLTYAKICVEICAHVGSSNILKIQEMIRNCTPIITEQTRKKDEGEGDTKESSEPKKDKEKDGKDSKDKNQKDGHPITDEEFIQMLSIVGIGLISFSDNLNCDMVFRTFAHFLKLGGYNIKCAVILTIAMTNLSDPKMNIIELLGKYSHSPNENVAAVSILSLGLVCAGTNNSRVSKMLFELNEFYRNKPNCIFAVKVSQGLLHLGKGLLTFSPQLESQQILRQSSICSVLAVMLHSLNPVDLIKQPYYLFFLAGAIRPKMLVTLDEELKPISIPVSVGQLVDTIGQAGNPRSICAFQTSSTPVLLNKNEKAEMATDQFIALGYHLEGFIVVKKAPKKPEEEMKTKIPDANIATMKRMQESKTDSELSILKPIFGVEQEKAKQEMERLKIPELIKVRKEKLLESNKAVSQEPKKLLKEVESSEVKQEQQKLPKMVETVEVTQEQKKLPEIVKQTKVIQEQEKILETSKLVHGSEKLSQAVELAEVTSEQKKLPVTVESAKAVQEQRKHIEMVEPSKKTLEPTKLSKIIEPVKAKQEAIQLTEILKIVKMYQQTKKFLESSQPVKGKQETIKQCEMIDLFKTKQEPKKLSKLVESIKESKKPSTRRKSLVLLPKPYKSATTLKSKRRTTSRTLRKIKLPPKSQTEISSGSKVSLIRKVIKSLVSKGSSKRSTVRSISSPKPYKSNILERKSSIPKIEGQGKKTADGSKKEEMKLNKTTKTIPKATSKEKKLRDKKMLNSK